MNERARLQSIEVLCSAYDKGSLDKTSDIDGIDLSHYIYATTEECG